MQINLLEEYNMDFIKYPSIENHYNGKFIDFIKSKFPDLQTKWYVTEKVHGANYSLWTDGKVVKAAKRTGFIKEGEKFYNHTPVFEAYKDAVKELSREVGVPIAVFGEIFGGGYNGESEGTKVQKEVQYCKHNDFIVFDILNLQTKRWFNMQDVIYYCQLHNIITVPVLKIYDNLDKAIEHTNEFGTFIPHIFGLEPIPGNIAEGIVITPAEPLHFLNGSRVIIKSKAEKFKESANEGPAKVVQSMLNERTQAVTKLISMNLTDNRMNSVVSKHGDTAPFPVLLTELVNDAIEDGVKEQYEALSEQEQKFVRKYVNTDACKLVKEIWNGSKTLAGMV